MRGVCDTTDARRQYVVDGFLVAILFYAYVADLQSSVAGGGLTGIKRLLVRSPVTLNHIESGKTQDNILLEVGKEETHETDAGEVVDASFLRFVI